MKTISIAILVSIGMAWAMANAGAAAQAAQDSSAQGISSVAAAVVSQGDVVATASAGAPAVSIVQWVTGDVTHMAAALAWVAVAMFLAFVYDSARN